MRLTVKTLDFRRKSNQGEPYAEWPLCADNKFATVLIASRGSLPR
jgi:hypothetical protein